MSDLNPDFRDDGGIGEVPDLGDLKAVHDYLEDATIDDTTRAKRADAVDRAEAGRSGSYRTEVETAVGRARGHGVPKEKADSDERSTGQPKGRSKRAS